MDLFGEKHSKDKMWTISKGKRELGRNTTQSVAHLRRRERESELERERERMSKRENEQERERARESKAALQNMTWLDFMD